MNHRHHIALCLLACCALVGATSRCVAAACELRNLGFDRSEVGWAHQPLSKLKRDTAYTLAQAK